MKIQLVRKRISLVILLGIVYFFFSGNKKREPIERTESPISLTTSDGAGLILKSYESNTVLDGFFAFTEIKLSFQNPENRQREGRFKIILPDNAHLARFAMQIDDKWQEGEVVEREKATRVYEDFLHRKQDPALLESDAGNEFSARIFPIPAMSEKKLILSYSTTLNSIPPKYTVPVVGLPQIEDFVLRVMYESNEFRNFSENSELLEDQKLVERKVFSITKKNYKPTKDFHFVHTLTKNLVSKQGKNFALKLVPFPETKEKKARLENLVILVDTSASSTLHFSDTVAKLEKLLPKLNLKESYIFGFDTSLSAYGKGLDGLKKLKDVSPLGASNLSKTIQDLGKTIGDQEFRLLVVSDSVLTAGETSKKGITEIFKKQKWIERVDFLIPASYKDSAVMDSLLKTGKDDGIAISFDSEITEIERRLRLQVLSMPSIKVNEANWFFAGSLSVLQPGDPLTIFGEMNSENGKAEEQLRIDGKFLEGFGVVSTEALLLEREVTSARIDRLLALTETESNADISSGLKLQAIELSTRNRIQCPLTSFLVLETAADYDRFQISRNALTDIMTVGLGGIEVLNRKSMLSYDFLNPDNIEKRKVEEQERIRLSKQKQREQERDRKDSPKKSEASTDISSNSQGINREEAFEDDNISSVSAETNAQTTKPIPGTDSLPIVHSPIENLPERNRFSVEFRTTTNRPERESEKREKIDPYQGKMKEYYIYLNAGENLKALDFARKWREESPEDILALLALGDSYFALGDRKNAVRSYTSFVDYFPRRADIRRWSGEKLLSIGMYEEAIDTFEKALLERPDHPSSYHLLTISYMKSNQWKKAYDTLMLGLSRTFPDRFQNVHDIFYDDLDLLYSLVKNSDKESSLPSLSKNSKLKLKSLSKEIRFILVWETDANDVDFHIYDKDNHHAFYSDKQLASGGELYADITGGYGPECFRIINPKAFPYRLEAHYYSRGPMGYGMGAMQIIRFDGEKKLEVETRSFVIMNDGAYVNLGKVK
jgi:tetratricopeptide (TPR) repeat protein